VSVEQLTARDANEAGVELSDCTSIRVIRVLQAHPRQRRIDTTPAILSEPALADQCCAALIHMRPVGH
jgi:hypothetical protein